MTELGTNRPSDRKAPDALLSVVINNFNYASFLGAAIDSALSQTYRPVEVVVVDDGSTDDSRAVLDLYGDRIEVVLKANGGMGSALNAGFRSCAGDVVIFLDSDDLLLPTAAGAAVDALCDPQTAKAHWRLREMNGDGHETGRLVPRGNLAEGDLADAVIADGPMSADGSPTSGNAWSRRFLEQVLPMAENEWTKHADSYLNTLAPLYGKLRLISEPQGLYRVHGTNDYASQPRLERLRRNFQMYHYRCRLLSAHLRKSGRDVHPVTWKNGNRHYDRIEWQYTTFQEIAAVIPAGETFILVDEGASGIGPMIAQRDYVRFPVTANDPRGRPADDDVAIEELERMRTDGAGFIVFIKPALWWLRGYQGLRRHLDTQYSRESETEFLIVYNLRP